MPFAPLRVCYEPGCPELVRSPDNRCPKHRRALQQTRNWSGGHRWFKTQRWQILRGYVLRANPFCVMCEAAGRETLAEDVHHKVPHGGDEALFFCDPAGLEGLCKAHHGAETRAGR